ncbi:MAG: glycosyltransferase family 2 protein [Thermoanaerobaculia bacterium]
MSVGPRVTILMPVYNGQRYVDEAIASVAGQGYDDFEFVIVDDGSIDDTPAILAGWAARDPRITVHRSPCNEGIPSALNRGLALARGEYIVRQDADDLCVAGRVAKQVAALDADPDTVLVSAGFEVIDEQGRRRGSVVPFEAPEVLAYLLHFSNSIGGHGQVMFRRDMVLALGNYRVEFDCSQDYDLWSRLAEHGRLRVLPITGMRYRMHDHSVTVKSGKRQRLNSLTISRRNLTAFLGEELDDREFDSMAAVWRQFDRRGAAPGAHRLFAKAYARFRKTNANRHHRRRVRMAKAQAFFLSAAMQAKRGHMLEAIQHLGYALLWHPQGCMQAAVAVAKRVVRYCWRAGVDVQKSLIAWACISAR